VSDEVYLNVGNGVENRGRNSRRLPLGDLKTSERVSQRLLPRRSHRRPESLRRRSG
jgi:hypothetical protein